MLRGEATARFFPATGGAPLVSVVHPIDLATLTTRSLAPNVIIIIAHHVRIVGLYSSNFARIIDKIFLFDVCISNHNMLNFGRSRLGSRVAWWRRGDQNRLASLGWQTHARYLFRQHSDLNLL